MVEARVAKVVVAGSCFLALELVGVAEIIVFKRHHRLDVLIQPVHKPGRNTVLKDASFRPPGQRFAKTTCGLIDGEASDTPTA